MSQFASQHPGAVVAILVVVVVMCGAIVLGAILLGRSLKVDLMGVHAELKPNGGESFRDVMDQRFNQIEGRLDKLETVQSHATAIVVNPPPEAA